MSNDSAMLRWFSEIKEVAGGLGERKSNFFMKLINNPTKQNHSIWDWTLEMNIPRVIFEYFQLVGAILEATRSACSQHVTFHVSNVLPKHQLDSDTFGARLKIGFANLLRRETS